MQITWKHSDSDFNSPLSFDDKVTIFRERIWGWHLHIAQLCINGGQVHDGSARVEPHPALWLWSAVAYVELLRDNREARRGVHGQVRVGEALWNRRQDGLSRAQLASGRRRGFAPQRPVQGGAMWPVSQFPGHAGDLSEWTTCCRAYVRSCREALAHQSASDPKETGRSSGRVLRSTSRRDGSSPEAELRGSIRLRGFMRVGLTRRLVPKATP